MITLIYYEIMPFTIYSSFQTETITDNCFIISPEVDRFSKAWENLSKK